MRKYTSHGHIQISGAPAHFKDRRVSKIVCPTDYAITVVQRVSVIAMRGVEYIYSPGFGRAQATQQMHIIAGACKISARRPILKTDGCKKSIARPITRLPWHYRYLQSPGGGWNIFIVPVLVRANAHRRSTCKIAAHRPILKTGGCEQSIARPITRLQWYCGSL